ncbi:MAG: D-hexose-6-phosphate mutarotase, partial [Spirochaetia bacterium]|nr:D-hexose-6-phosphate mutarotase [Spirochaetia bacterium]
MTTPFIPGEGSLPKLKLRHKSGATAEIYRHGAHVTSWKTPDGKEQLFLSAATPFKAATPIRGGVPIVFPQFGNFGPLTPHGFARIKDWDLAEHRENVSTWRLTDDAETLAVWPHPFELLFEVRLEEKSLSLTFTVKNTGEAPFSFRSALHTYFRVEDIHRTSLTGMKDVVYQDRLSGQNDLVHRDEPFSFTGETDLIVPSAPDLFILNEGGRKLEIS